MDITDKDVRFFLGFFIRNKKLTPLQKKRRDTLLVRDYDAILKASGSDIEPASGRESVGKNEAQPTETKIQAGNASLPDIEYISPKFLHDFLYAYNQDPLLKYTSHLIDSQEVIDEIAKASGSTCYDYFKHVELLKQSFYSLLDKLKKDNPDIFKMNMVARARNYLMGGKDKTWGSREKIKFNWMSPQLKKWANENPGKVPNPGKNIAKKQRNSGFNLSEPFLSEITGQRVVSFRELVIYYKNLFHIRLGNSLLLLIKRKNQEEVWYNNVNVSFKEGAFPENIEIFTDVDKLLWAYDRIIKICRKNQNERYGDKPDIELSLIEADGKTCFCIHHKNSVYGKSHLAASRLGTDQAELIKNNVNGLCNLYIEADFGQGKGYRVDLWSPNGGLCEEIKGKTEGVKYIIEF